jgi:Zn-dependent membrane protease YugP
MFFLFLSLIIFGISWGIQSRLRSKFKQYSAIPFRGNMTGAQVAARMLSDNGITDVKIQSVDGKLTDHYNPFDKTVNLSPEVYNGVSVAAAAIAAHECGHAVQHSKAYFWLGLRSRVVPAAGIASKWTQWIIMAGFFLLWAGPLGFVLLAIGVLLFSLTTLFTFITLPVEFDASNRALRWLETSGLVTSQEHYMAKDALTWAAMTYVVAALASLVNLLYYASFLLRRR